MISAGSAVSDSRTAPSTDCSASRFCGGAIGPSGSRGALPLPWPLRDAVGGAHGAAESRLARPDRTYVLPARRGVCRTRRERPPRGRPSGGGSARGCGALLLLDDHGLDGRGDAVLDLDDDHARADGADRLLEVDLAAVDRDAAGLLDRVDDVLRRDGAEQAAVVAGLVRIVSTVLLSSVGALLARWPWRSATRALGGDLRGARRRRSRPWWRARPACAGSGSCAGSPWRRRRPCPLAPSVSWSCSRIAWGIAA